MRRSFLRSKLKNGETMNFLKKLALLMEAGIPLSSVLDSTAQAGPFRSIAEKVKGGGSFSGALDQDIFPPAVIGIISVSEMNGALSSGLSRACQYLEKKETFRKKIAASLLYPAFILLLCCASIFILVSVLLPSFAQIFQSIGTTLPPLSRFILVSARYFPIAAVISAIAIYVAARYSLSDRGFNLPVVGGARKKLVLASFCGSMAESLSSGMNIIDSLSLSAGLVNSPLYKEKLLASKGLVSAGNGLSGSLRGTGLFNEIYLSLISAGEHSSSLGSVFSRLSVLYEEEIESDLKTFASLVEPASTLVTGLVVGVIVFAMFMPIVKLINVLGS